MPSCRGYFRKVDDVIFFGDTKMKTLVIAAIAAMFAFAVHASEKPAAANQQAAAAKQMTTEECTKAMAACKDEACKQELRTQNGCQ